MYIHIISYGTLWDGLLDPSSDSVHIPSVVVNALSGRGSLVNTLGHLVPKP